MFKDKVYESMDEVSRIFEPFQFDLNDELAEFPDKIEVLPEDILQDEDVLRYGMDVMRFVRYKANQLNLNEIEANYALLANHEFFKFQVDDGKFEDLIMTLDASNPRLSSKIFIVKEKIAFDEKQLESMCKQHILRTLRYQFNRSSDMNKPRFNEIADIYGADKVKSERSCRGKAVQFRKHMEKLIDEKTLDIRDMKLCESFAMWIVKYVKDGNLAALNNLTRIKIMTHEERPIYSIEEMGV